MGNKCRINNNTACSSLTTFLRRSSYQWNRISLEPPEVYSLISTFIFKISLIFQNLMISFSVNLLSPVFLIHTYNNPAEMCIWKKARTRAHTMNQKQRNTFHCIKVINKQAHPRNGGLGEIPDGPRGQTYCHVVGLEDDVVVGWKETQACSGRTTTRITAIEVPDSKSQWRFFFLLAATRDFPVRYNFKIN